MIPLSGNLSSEGCEVQHLTEVRLERLRLVRRKKLDIIDQQRHVRLFSTFGVCIDQTSHIDQRSLGFATANGIQLEVREVLKSAERSQAVFFPRVGAVY